MEQAEAAEPRYTTAEAIEILESQIRLGKPCPVCGNPVTMYKERVSHTK